VLRASVNAEISIVLKAAPRGAVLKSALLHEIATDLIVSFKMEELFREYCRLVSTSYHVRPGFVTRNFPRFLEFVSGSNMPLDSIIVMTPFNPLGFQMNPSREECEAVLKDNMSTNLIATSIMASGYLELKDAIRYIKSLPTRVSVAVGVSTANHARETFSLLRAST
jgi:hypothetical protein